MNLKELHNLVSGGGESERLEIKIVEGEQSER